MRRLLMSLVVLGSSGCVELAETAGPFAQAKTTFLIPDGKEIDSGHGVGVSAIPSTRLLLHFIGVGEVMALELEDHSEALQSRLYGKMGLVLSMGMRVSGMLGAAYTDLEDAPDWSVRHLALLYGVELSVHYPDTLYHPWAVFADVRWIHVGMDLEKSGYSEEPLEGIEIGVGVQWHF